ncbi:hypothetical protein ASE04_09735 [Rhizobium sp. Root708]|nr:hypothetical protein ASE04_09735 [Rhizobium sp. Root708]
MAELLESYALKHWMDSHSKEEAFFILQARKVSPKTFLAYGSNRFVGYGERIPRGHVIAACSTEAKAIALRDKFFSIGVETGELVEKEMYRRIEKFAERKRAAAEQKIRRLLPLHFRSEP